MVVFTWAALLVLSMLVIFMSMASNLVPIFALAQFGVDVCPGFGPKLWYSSTSDEVSSVASFNIEYMFEIDVSILVGVAV